MTSRDPQQDLFTRLEAAVQDGCFPGCVALVWRDGALLYHEAHGHFATHEAAPERFRGVERGAIYDLASLTKVLATTTLAAIAVSEGRIDLDAVVPAPWSRGGAEEDYSAAAARWKSGRNRTIAGLSRVGWTRLLRSTAINGPRPSGGCGSSHTLVPV